MAKKITFNSNRIVEPFTIILSTRGMEHLGQIGNIEDTSISYVAHLNSANELSFTVYHTFNSVEEYLWDEIENLKLAYVKELDEYFEIKVDISETDDVVKNITGTSLCEAELGQIMIYGTEINTEIDIARPEYDPDYPTIFYDQRMPERSLLHRILEKAPHYTIGHVDSTLAELQRTFSIDGTSIYDFMVGECAEQFNCIFEFDSTTRTISAYDLYSVCKNDDCSYYKTNTSRYRGEFNDFCPICGSDDIQYYGDDTTVFVDSTNLTEELGFSTDVDSIKNTFRLVAGDDEMTAAIRNNNPNGSQYLTYFSDEAKKDMPQELVDKLNSYDTLYQSYQDEYTTLATEIYETLDEILKLTSTMMPKHIDEDTDAEKEAAKLTRTNLSPLSLSSVTSSTSVATVNSAITQYAKVYVRQGYYKVSVNSGSFTGYNNGTGVWTGNFKVESYSDEDDVAYSQNITVDVNSNYTDFLEQKIQKQVANDGRSIDGFYTVVMTKNTSDYQAWLEQFCLNRLTSFFDSLQSCIDILCAAGQGEESSESYDKLYSTYYQKLQLTQDEIDVRQAEIDTQLDRRDSLYLRRSNIQDALNFEKYLGDNLYLLYCSYRREDTYENSNYISDGKDNATIFELANEFIENAQQELIHSGTAQHSISTNLYNLLLMKEFEPIVDGFMLGNFIRVQVDSKIYRLRLISYQLNFNDITTLNTEFSDMTRISGTMNDVRSVLNSAQQMATSFSAVSKQASIGKVAGDFISNVLANALDASLVNIKNNEYEEVTVDNHGVILKEYDDISDNYDKKQARLTHNALVFTKDNWQTAETALGEIHYTLNGVSKTEYGVAAKVVISGNIIGGDIYSDNYSTTGGKGTHFDLRSGSFSLAGGKISYDSNMDVVSLEGVELKWADITDADDNIASYGYQTASQVTKITQDTVTTSYVNALNVTAGSVAAENITGTTISGKTISGGTITGTTINGSTFTGGAINIGPIINAYGQVIDYNFKVDTSGNLTSNGIATIKGEMNILPDANSGGDRFIYFQKDAKTISGRIGTYGSADIMMVGSTYPYNLRLYSSGNDSLDIYGRKTKIHSNGGSGYGLELYDYSDTQYMKCSQSSFVYRNEARDCPVIFADKGSFINVTSGKLILSTSDKLIYIQGQASRDYYFATKKYVDDKKVSINWSDITDTPTIPTVPTSTRGFNKADNQGNGNAIDFANAYSGEGRGATIQYAKGQSDSRLKIAIESLENITDIYMKIIPKSFYYKPGVRDEDNSNKRYGLIAQDLLNVLPDVVISNKAIEGTPIYQYCGKEYYSVNYKDLHAFHIKMIQTHQNQITQLEQENIRLKGEIAIIKQQLEEIKNGINKL